MELENILSEEIQMQRTYMEITNKWIFAKIQIPKIQTSELKKGQPADV